MLCGQIFVMENYPLSDLGKLKGRFSTRNLERFLKEAVGEHINSRSAEHELFNFENNAESQLCKVYVASLAYHLAPFSYDIGSSAQQDMGTSIKSPEFDCMYRSGRQSLIMQRYNVTVEGQIYMVTVACSQIILSKKSGMRPWYAKCDDISANIKCIVFIGTGDPGIL
jgi:hypothetical protein